MNKSEIERINTRIENIKEHYFAPNGKPWTPQDLSKAEQHIDELIDLVKVLIRPIEKIVDKPALAAE